LIIVGLALSNLKIHSRQSFLFAPICKIRPLLRLFKFNSGSSWCISYFPIFAVKAGFLVGTVEFAISFLINVFISARYVHFRFFSVFGVVFNPAIVIPFLQLNQLNESQVAKIKYSLPMEAPPLNCALTGTLTCPCCVDGQK